MPEYNYRCKCGKTYTVEAHMGDAPQWVSCPCGQCAIRAWTMPRVSLNKWNPNYKFVDVSEELDCDKDAIAMGGDE